MIPRGGVASRLVVVLCRVVALTVLLGASAAQAQTAVAPASGTGTQADPYQITELGNLVWMSVDVSNWGVTAGKYYELKNDIDAADTANWSGGFPPIGQWQSDSASPAFSGVFDGQGHVIGGLTVDLPAATYVGLFGLVGGGGKVSNLTLEDVNVAGLNFVGGLVGQNSGPIDNCAVSGVVSCNRAACGGLVGCNGGAITNCHASALVTNGLSVDPASGLTCLGGLVGRAYGTIANCYATGEVTADGGPGGAAAAGGLVGQTFATMIADCYATGAVSLVDGGDVGGLVGFCSGPIANCCATGAVSGANMVGGLAGYNYGFPVTDCYAAGKVTSTRTHAGGLVGYNYDSPAADFFPTAAARRSWLVGGRVGTAPGSSYTSCYWDTQTTGQSTSAGGTGKTTAEMKQRATFHGWNFPNVWGIVENADYPYLACIQEPPLAPVNAAPANGALGVPQAPTLVGSAFADRNTTDTQAASQWQVRAAASPSSGTLTAFDSGATTVALTQCVVPPGVLDWLTDYVWRVRYEDNHGAWSAWSAPTAFRTQPEPPSVPTGVTASKGAFAGRVRVAWIASAHASDYAVWRSTRPTTGTATALTGWIDGTAGTGYDDLTTKPGVIYYYWVIAAADSLGGFMSTFSACDAGWAGAGIPFPSNYQGSLWIVH